MALSADEIIDRRKLRRKVTLWRVISVIAIIGIIGVISWFAGANQILPQYQAHIARVQIAGFIGTDIKRSRALQRLAKSEAEAVLVHIDSPGGSVSGAEELYLDLRKIAEEKPVVAVVRGLAASGGYITAIGADHIIAGNGALVGSIGVIVQYPEVFEALNSLGIEVKSVKSTPLKAEPSGLNPTPPAAVAALEAVVADSYNWFRNLVGERRDMQAQALNNVADGRIFTGRQAVELGLVDEIGNEDTARKWLAENKEISEDLPIYDWKWGQELNDFPLTHTLAPLENLLAKVGLHELSMVVRSAALTNQTKTMQLDGLLAIWHPSTGME